MTFNVKTEQFQGPLELLLDLIEKRKLFINDISLAKVTDDFIDYVRSMESLPMDESAQFILVASTLLLIKSKSLLPELELTEEEKYDVESLETRLKIYKRLKEASLHVSRLFGEEMIFGQSQMRPTTPVFAPSEEVRLDKILVSLKDLISRLPKKENLPKTIVKKVISLEDMIGNLTERVSKHLKMSFKEFTREHRENRANIIVGFLAMLELVKQGIVHVTQDKNFDDIQIETKEVGVPRY